MTTLPLFLDYTGKPVITLDITDETVKPACGKIIIDLEFLSNHPELSSLDSISVCPQAIDEFWEQHARRQQHEGYSLVFRTEYRGIAMLIHVSWLHRESGPYVLQNEVKIFVYDVVFGDLHSVEAFDTILKGALGTRPGALANTAALMPRGGYEDQLFFSARSQATSAAIIRREIYDWVTALKVMSTFIDWYRRDQPVTGQFGRYRPCTAEYGYGHQGLYFKWPALYDRWGFHLETGEQYESGPLLMDDFGTAVSIPRGTYGEWSEGDFIDYAGEERFRPPQGH